MTFKFTLATRLTRRPKYRWFAYSVAASLIAMAVEAEAQDSDAPALRPTPPAEPDRDTTPNDPAAKPPVSSPNPGATPPPEQPSDSGADPGGSPPTAPPSAAAAEQHPEAAPESAAEVTVVGTRIAKTAGSAHVVRQKDLDQFKYDDPASALRTVPGVYSRGEDGMGLRPNIGIRGVNPDRSKKITLMEDGVLVSPAAYSAPAAYYFPLMARVERIFVLKGPASISFGPQTVGGAINLMTRSIPAATTGMVDVAAGEYGYNKLHGYFGSSDEHTGYLVEGVHIGSTGFKELPNGADIGFYRNEFMFKARYVPEPHVRGSSEFVLKATYSDEVSNETYLGITDADFRANPLQRYGTSELDRMKNFRTGISLTHKVEPAPNFSITTTIYRNDFYRVWRKVNGFRGADLFTVLSHPEDPHNAVFAAVISGRADSSTAAETLLIGPNQRDFVSQGIESRARWDVPTGPFAHRIEYGMRLHYDRVERRHSEDPFLVVGGQPVPAGGPTVVTAFNEAWTEAIALHAADAITWQRLTVTPGIRVEAMRSAFVDRSAGTESRALNHVFLPGVGAFYALTDSLGAFAGVHRGFSPTPPGSSDVKPEDSINYEGGARFSEPNWRFETVGFYNDYSNITDVCTFSSGCVQENVDRQYDGGKARIYGVEAFAQLSPAVGSLTIPVTAAYTYTHAEFQSSFHSDDPIFGDVVAGDQMPYVPRNQATVSIGVDSRYGGGAVAGTYVARMREEAGNEPMAETLATDEQFVVDLSANCRIIKQIAIYGNVRNLFNDHSIVSHRPFGARPNAPRWVQVGVKATF